MQDNENDWFRDLAQNPYSQKGFTPELKRKIMRELDQKQAPRRFKWMVAACSFVVLIALIGFLMKIDLFSPPGSPNALKVTAVSQPVVAPIEDREVMHSVLLLGLRTEERTGSSSYRTLVISEQNGEVQTVAKGNGILMPYGQQFWHIERNPEVSYTDTKALIATQVGKMATTKPISEKDEPLVSGENNITLYPGTLLYAGNRYLTLEVDLPKDKKSGVGDTRALWTIDLKDYAAGATPQMKRVQLAEVTDSNVNSDNWGVVRQRGKWLAVVTTDGGQSKSPGGLSLATVMTQLSETLANHNQLDRPWGNVLKLEAKASDAVCSPFGDMLAVFTDTEIQIYSATEGIESQSSPLLRIEKKNGESLVMVQWANQNYAEKWIRTGQNELTE